jgi:glycerophosphoryl diester phosphodiesterase
MLLLGHRGASDYAAENTIEAFELALQHGCHGFEFDVRVAADGEAVICHDSQIRRRRIAEHSCAELLARAPALPTLRQILARFSERAYLYIELKVEGLEGALLRALEEHPPRCGYVVGSFFPSVLQAVHRRDASIRLGYICRTRKELPRWRDLPVVAVMPQHRLLNTALIQELHAAGKQIITWTVNRPSEMRSLSAAGLDGILSDDTALLCKTVSRLPSPVPR